MSTADNLFDYFNSRVSQASAEEGIKLADDTLLYVATLLSERARADRPSPPDQTLAELLARAAQSPPAGQAATYRELGDRALYRLGYFEESLQHSVVGPDYYADMGSAAYARTARVFERWFADAFGPVFRELAARFRDCVTVVASVRDQSVKERPEDVLSLYRRWLDTGDQRLAEALKERGILIRARSSGDA